MKSSKVFLTHSSAVSALFVLGNAIIRAPQGSADEFTFLGYLLSCVIGFMLYLALLPLAQTVCGETAADKGKILKIFQLLLLVTVSVFSLFCAADTFRDYVYFVKDVILNKTSMTVTVIIFAAVCLFFARQRQENILKFSLVSFWFVLILILFFFFATMHNFNLRNIFIFRLPNLKTVCRQTLPYVKNPVLPALLLPFYNQFVFRESRKGAAFWGLFYGFVLLGLAVLSAILLFGTTFAGELGYPYSSAISTVTIGSLFTRLDGFSYFIYFGSAIIRITVSLFVMVSALKRLNRLSLQKT